MQGNPTRGMGIRVPAQKSRFFGFLPFLRYQKTEKFGTYRNGRLMPRLDASGLRPCFKGLNVKTHPFAWIYNPWDPGSPHQWMIFESDVFFWGMTEQVR